MSYDNILAEVKGRVLTITLNRPKALNALNNALMNDVADAIEAHDDDPEIGCIVITGSEKAFAAGADIKEMKDKTPVEMYDSEWFGRWDVLKRARTPIIAAVSGYALGGGCELAMMCDFILASDTAKFGQPEVNLGILPGMGGTQRLTLAVGKAKAMEMCLSGRHIDAAEAESAGLVARVIPSEDFAAEVADTAAAIAEKSKLSTRMIVEAVNASAEMPLSQGLMYERRLFHMLFASEDQAEGMEAFVEKRSPEFCHR